MLARTAANHVQVRDAILDVRLPRLLEAEPSIKSREVRLRTNLHGTGGVGVDPRERRDDEGAPEPRSARGRRRGKAAERGFGVGHPRGEDANAPVERPIGARLCEDMHGTEIVVVDVLENARLLDDEDGRPELQNAMELEWGEGVERLRLQGRHRGGGYPTLAYGYRDRRCGVRLGVGRKLRFRSRRALLKGQSYEEATSARSPLILRVRRFCHGGVLVQPHHPEHELGQLGGLERVEQRKQLGIEQRQQLRVQQRQ